MTEFASYIFLFFAVVTILATLIPLSPKEYWWIRMFDFPRLQIIAAGIIALLGFYLFNHGKGTLALLLEISLLICIVYQSWRIFPYTPFYKKTVLDTRLPESEQDRIRIVVTNVLETNRNYQACLDMLRKADPDVILAVETDQLWKDHLEELEKDYTYTLFMPLSNTYGMLFYSRLKLINPEIRFLLEPDVPSVHTIIEMPSGAPVTFHGLHPRPPAPQEAETSVPRDAELIVVGLNVKDHPGPTIVAGDMNDVAWSHTSKLFRKNSGLLDPRIGRGLYATFNAFYLLLRWPLDHVFHTRDFKIVSLRRMEKIGSDHFPICITLSYEPETQNEQEKPVADAQDKKEAAEKVEKAETMKAEKGSLS
ncbi:endonuclease/exonuclease/phosphatase family protein [Adhaeribacter sp. BT258]|uniref:Endonuclease/exonuclease/phosphatase family protein n=1 Tax=Adhaeribacter terrigena TaxID=2793070 RepID=A0ABS1C2W2_9BACT|nr:endonuclease/exonuclease/phosphatase family protein [Adhaeribacter terrigena]MBK0403741.1 endonuclease/exonuclease/phosphatase family protein [Adhaeribacter terrigena]